MLEEYDKAVLHMREVLRHVQDRAPGGRYDVQVAKTHQRLGDMYTLAKRPREARQNFKSAAHIFSSILGAKVVLSCEFCFLVFPINCLLLYNSIRPCWQFKTASRL